MSRAPVSKSKVSKSKKKSKSKRSGPAIPVSSGAIKLGAVFVVLFGVWLYFFSGLFHAGPTLEVIAGLQAPRRGDVFRVTLAFNQDILPEEVFVYRPDDYDVEATTADQAQRMGITPVWHLVKDEEYDPAEHRGREPRAVRSIRYGRWIRGLKPAEGMSRRAQRLEPGVTYRAIIHGGGAVGHVDFQTKERSG